MIEKEYISKYTSQGVQKIITSGGKPAIHYICCFDQKTDYPCNFLTVQFY